VAYRAGRAVLQADRRLFTLRVIHSENWFPRSAIML
jgi:hypothetical protein